MEKFNIKDALKAIKLYNTRLIIFSQTHLNYDWTTFDYAAWERLTTKHFGRPCAPTYGMNKPEIIPFNERCDDLFGYEYLESSCPVRPYFSTYKFTTKPKSNARYLWDIHDFWDFPNKENRNIFVYANPYNETTNSCKEPNITGWRTFYLDYDYKDYEDLFDSYESFISFFLDNIKKLPLAPTYVSASGHGIHIVYLLSKDITFDKIPLPEIKTRYQMLIKGRIDSILGLYHDPAADLATQLIRLPGSVNTKPGKEPILSYFLDCSSEKYTFEQLLHDFKALEYEKTEDYTKAQEHYEFLKQESIRKRKETRSKNQAKKQLKYLSDIACCPEAFKEHEHEILKNLEKNINKTIAEIDQNIFVEGSSPNHYDAPKAPKAKAPVRNEPKPWDPIVIRHRPISRLVNNSARMMLYNRMKKLEEYEKRNHEYFDFRENFLFVYFNTIYPIYKDKNVVNQKLFEMNAKLKNPLSPEEIIRSIINYAPETTWYSFKTDTICDICVMNKADRAWFKSSRRKEKSAKVIPEIELKVLELLKTGLSMREVAEELNITKRKVQIIKEKHMKKSKKPQQNVTSKAI